VPAAGSAEVELNSSGGGIKSVQLSIMLAALPAQPHGISRSSSQARLDGSRQAWHHSAIGYPGSAADGQVQCSRCMGVPCVFTHWASSMPVLLQQFN